MMRQRNEHGKGSKRSNWRKHRMIVEKDKEQRRTATEMECGEAEHKEQERGVWWKGTRGGKERRVNTCEPKEGIFAGGTQRP